MTDTTTASRTIHPTHSHRHRHSSTARPSTCSLPYRVCDRMAHGAVVLVCGGVVQAGLRPKKEGSRKQRRELKNRKNKVRGKAKAKVGAAGGPKKG